MDKVKIEWAVNVVGGIETITLEEMGIPDLETFNQLSENQKADLIQEVLFNNPNQPFMVFEKIIE